MARAHARVVSDAEVARYFVVGCGCALGASTCIGWRLAAFAASPGRMRRAGEGAVSYPRCVSACWHAAEAFSFDYCSGLTTVALPAGLTFIGAQAFKRCGLSQWHNQRIVLVLLAASTRAALPFVLLSKEPRAPTWYAHSPHPQPASAARVRSQAQGRYDAANSGAHRRLRIRRLLLSQRVCENKTEMRECGQNHNETHAVVSAKTQRASKGASRD